MEKCYFQNNPMKAVETDKKLALKVALFVGDELRKAGETVPPLRELVDLVLDAREKF